MGNPTFLIGSFFILIIWVIFYYHRKDVRKEMIFMSILVSIMGVILDAFFWTKDWWHPETITGTLIGVEDIIAGFAIGGITAVLYEEIFKIKLSKKRIKVNNQLSKLLAVLGPTPVTPGYPSDGSPIKAL